MGDEKQSTEATGERRKVGIDTSEIHCRRKSWETRKIQTGHKWLGFFIVRISCRSFCLGKKYSVCCVAKWSMGSLDPDPGRAEGFSVAWTKVNSNFLSKKVSVFGHHNPGSGLE